MDLKTNDKPILYLFNQPWCGACNKLKENFQLEGDKLLSLSKRFLMVNVGGDDNNLFGVSLAYLPQMK
jgi:thiol-disulfide isomerase/thioredoxin